MTALLIIAFIASLWIAHGFWLDYIESKRPRTEEEKEQIRKLIQDLELDLFHKRLHLQERASPWKPKYTHKPKYDTPKHYQLGNGNIIDLELCKTINPMFISAELKLAYLKSPEWRTIRTERLKIAQNKCECCGSTIQLECHHITYKRLTAEHIDDLVILCGGSNGCHQRIHNLLGYNRTTEYPISILKDLAEL